VAAITQHIIGFVKPLSLELQKCSCDVVEAQIESNRTKIVSSKPRTEAVACILVYTSALRALRTQSTSSIRQKHCATAEVDTTEA